MTDPTPTIIPRHDKIAAAARRQALDEAIEAVEFELNRRLETPTRIALSRLGDRLRTLRDREAPRTDGP